MVKGLLSADTVPGAAVFTQQVWAQFLPQGAHEVGERGIGDDVREEHRVCWKPTGGVSKGFQEKERS